MVYSACFVGVVYVTRPVAVGPVLCSAVVGYVVVSAASSEALHTLAYSINQSINQSINLLSTVHSETKKCKLRKNSQ